MLRLAPIAPSEWRQAAQALLNAFPEAAVFALSGPLGAGKTSLVRGMVAALGGDAGQVQSPTFVLERRYPLAGTHPFAELSHWDWYRLNEEEVRRLPWQERIRQRCVVCVEWPERALDEWQALQEPFVWVTLQEAGEEQEARALTAQRGFPNQHQHE